MDPVEFLTFEDVLTIHRQQLELYGGQDGFIDENVVRSAVAQPQLASQYLGNDMAYLAAAYLYHLASTQGFLDGNKRAGANAALQFLFINGLDLRATSDEVFELTMKVANHELDKDDLRDWFRARLMTGETYDD